MSAVVVLKLQKGLFNECYIMRRLNVKMDKCDVLSPLAKKKVKRKNCFIENNLLLIIH